jgi:hypothetical protein
MDTLPPRWLLFLTRTRVAYLTTRQSLYHVTVRTYSPQIRSTKHLFVRLVLVGRYFGTATDDHGKHSSPYRDFER